MIVHSTDYAKSPTYADGLTSPLDQLVRPLPLTLEYREFLSHLWRGGQHGIFWTASRARLTADEANHLNQVQKRKKKARAGDGKVRLTTWVDLSLPLPDFLPPQDFRSPFYGLTPFDLERRLVRPDESGLSNLYHGVNPFFSPDARLLPVDKFGRRSIKFKDGTANESVAAVNCILGEIDVKNFGGDWQAVDAYIKSLPIQPSVIIRSGGGYHLYWLLRDTFLLYGEGFVRDLSRFELIRGVQHGWVGSFPRLDQAAKGIPWLLRPAGSLNVKEKYAPNYLPVDFVARDMGLLYEVSDFQEVIADLAKLAIVVPASKPAATKSQAKRANQSASKPSPQPAANQPSWQRPTFEHLPSFGSQRAKIDWHLQYFNHHDYHDWRRVALPLSGEPDGYEIWSDWSRKSYKFDEVTQKATWEEIQQGRREIEKSGKKPAGLGVLINWARKRGAPTTRDEGEYQPVRKDNNRVYLVELRRGVGEQLASLIKPNAWALLNPDGADNVFWLPKRRQGKGKRKPKPLQSVVLDHINGSTRRALFGGKRQRTKTCLVIAQTAMTRFLALRADDAKQAHSAQMALAGIGLTSLSYPVKIQLEHTSEKRALNADLSISYIYKADAFSKNNDLGKMDRPAIDARFFDATSVRKEQSYVVLVLFSEDVPASLLHTHTTHTQLDPIVSLALPSVSPPYFAQKTLKMSLTGPTSQKEFIIKSGNVGFRAWHDLLSADIFNDPTSLIGLQVESNQQIQRIRAVRARVERVQVADLASVAQWHNRRHVRLTSQACGCGQALMTYDSGDGYEVGWCVVCRGQPVTHFAQEAHALGITPHELATQITMTYQLGQAGGYVIEEQPQTSAVDMETLVAEHEEYVADIREQLREDINRRVVEGTGRGRIAIYGATAGVGKSTITRELMYSWRKLGLTIRVTTDTKKLSYEWHDELKGGILIIPFVFESLLECCDCYSYEAKIEMLEKGYKFKHKKDCVFVVQISEMLRGDDLKQKKTAILRHEHLRLMIGGKRLVGGANVYVHDEALTKALIESDSVDLYTIVKATLTRMLDYGCNDAEVGIVAALYEVCRQRRVGMYQHVDGSVIVGQMEEWLRGQGLTLSFCLEAIEKTPFAREPRLEPEEATADLNLPKIWIPKFLKAMKQTLKNSIHPTFFLVQTSKDKRYSRLEIESWIKHSYLPEHNLPLDEGEEVHIILDATPNRLIYEALLHNWKGKIDFVSYTCPPSPQHKIYQIDGLNLTRKHLKDKEGLRVTSRKIAAILNDLGLFLDGAVTRKDIKEPFGGHFGLDDDMVLNYRNQRGSNKLKNAQTVVMLADGTVPTNALLRRAHALWSHDTKPFEEFENGGYFAQSGARWVAKDERLQAVLDDSVLAEGNQGSQRIRLINGGEPKNLLIASIHDATELIDRLKPEQVTRIDAKRLHGNKKEVREALVIYHDRLIESGRVANTGISEVIEPDFEPSMPPIEPDFEPPMPPIEPSMPPIETDVLPVASPEKFVWVELEDGDVIPI